VGKAVIGVLAVIAVVAAIVFAVGFLGPVIAGLGLLLAATVILNPAGLGSRVRNHLGWWSVPGMRSASGSALTFSALLLAYSVPVPMGAFALSLSPTAESSDVAVFVPAQSSASPLPRLTLPTPTAYATVPPVPTGPAAPSASPTGTSVSIAIPPFSLIPVSNFPPPPPRPTPTPVQLCGAPPNPWGYNFCGGPLIQAPPGNFCSYFACVPAFRFGAGDVVECVDGKYSHRGECFFNRGELRSLHA
jgi:hypothetical protein